MNRLEMAIAIKQKDLKQRKQIIANKIITIYSNIRKLEDVKKERDLNDGELEYAINLSKNLKEQQELIEVYDRELSIIFGLVGLANNDLIDLESMYKEYVED